ncbi:MAG: hypothetical protein R6U32_00200 [Candidatus Woesearchaeota archaeon]
MDKYKESMKYLGLKADNCRTWDQIEHYSARKGGSFMLMHKTGIPEFDEEWMRYDRE